MKNISILIFFLFVIQMNAKCPQECMDATSQPDVKSLWDKVKEEFVGNKNENTVCIHCVDRSDDKSTYNQCGSTDSFCKNSKNDNDIDCHECVTICPSECLKSTMAKDQKTPNLENLKDIGGQHVCTTCVNERGHCMKDVNYDSKEENECWHTWTKTKLYETFKYCVGCETPFPTMSPTAPPGIFGDLGLGLDKSHDVGLVIGLGVFILLCVLLIVWCCKEKSPEYNEMDSKVKFGTKREYVRIQMNKFI